MQRKDADPAVSRPRLEAPPWLWGPLFFVESLLGFLLLGREGRETAGLESLLVPFVLVVIAAAFFGLGWGVLALSDWWDSRREEKRPLESPREP